MISEENGKTVLDNTLVVFGGAMHGSNHACNELPLGMTGPDVDSFGAVRADVPRTEISELLAV